MNDTKKTDYLPKGIVDATYGRLKQKAGDYRSKFYENVNPVIEDQINGSWNSAKAGAEDMYNRPFAQERLFGKDNPRFNPGVSKSQPGDTLKAIGYLTWLGTLAVDLYIMSSDLGHSGDGFLTFLTANGLGLAIGGLFLEAGKPLNERKNYPHNYEPGEGTKAFEDRVMLLSKCFKQIEMPDI